MIVPGPAAPAELRMTADVTVVYPEHEPVSAELVPIRWTPIEANNASTARPKPTWYHLNLCCFWLLISRAVRHYC